MVPQPFISPQTKKTPPLPRKLKVVGLGCEFPFYKKNYPHLNIVLVSYQCNERDGPWNMMSVTSVTREMNHGTLCQ